MQISKVDIEGKELIAPPTATHRRKSLLTYLAVTLLALTVSAVITVVIVYNVREQQAAASLTSNIKAFPSSSYTDPAFYKPKTVSSDGLTVTQDTTVNTADGSSIRFTYTARHVPDAMKRIIAMDFDERVVNASCADGLLFLTFTSAAVAMDIVQMIQAASTPMMIAGSHHWGCPKLGVPNATNTPATIQHKIVSVATTSSSANSRRLLASDPATLGLTLAPANITDFFQHISVHYSTAPKFSSVRGMVQNMTSNTDLVGLDFINGSSDPTSNIGKVLTNFRDAPATGVGASAQWLAMQSTITSRRNLGFWSSLVSYAEDFADEVGDIVEDAFSSTKNALETVVGAFEGELTLGSNTAQTIKSYTWTGSHYDDIDCTKSYATTDLGVLFELNVQDYKLQTAKLEQTGNIAINLGCTISKEEQWSYNKVTSIYQDQSLGTIDFYIGVVPFHVEATIDMTIGVKANLDAKASVTANVEASASAQVGVNYDQSSGWSFVAPTTWDHKYTLPSVSASADLTSTVSLTPTITLTADWVGSCSATVVPYLAFNADVSGTASAGGGGSSSDDCSYNLGWGLNVAGDAKIDLEDPFTGNEIGCSFCTKDTGSRNIYSTGLNSIYESKQC